MKLKDFNHLLNNHGYEAVTYLEPASVEIVSLDIHDTYNDEECRKEYASITTDLYQSPQYFYPMPKSVAKLCERFARTDLNQRGIQEFQEKIERK